MIKNLILAALAFLLGATITTLLKDREILQLQKRIKHLNSYEYFSGIFQPAYEGGIREGERRCAYGLIANANLN